LTHYVLVELPADSVSAARLRGLILQEGPLAWAAFDRTSSKAVVAFFDREEFFPAVREAIEAVATICYTVEVDYSKANPNIGRLLPRPQGDTHDTLIFVRCPPGTHEDLYAIFGEPYTHVGTIESGGLAVIRMPFFGDKDLPDLLEGIPAYCPVMDGIIVTETFWGNMGNDRDWL
jgi:hypothetical protein